VTHTEDLEPRIRAMLDLTNNADSRIDVDGGLIPRFVIAG
jgi:hypothetical protein